MYKHQKQQAAASSSICILAFAFP